MTAGRNLRASDRSGSTESSATPRSPSRLKQLERKEGQLWRYALIVLIALAATLALLSWETIRNLPEHLEALPVGLVILVILFGAYVWFKSRKIAELRGLIQGFQQRAEAPPSEEQIAKLFDLVASSQQGYRELMDTFDDLLFLISLEGEIRAANRSFAELAGRPFSEIIGHQLDEFFDDPEGSGRAAAERALPQLVEQRRWAGVIRVRVKSSAAQAAMRYFDCVLHAMVKDHQVVGISGLARDVTRHREAEARFTELFETLQEGVYFTTPEGNLLDANPALVRLLGYDSKEELLGVKVNDLYFDAGERAKKLGEVNPHGTAQARETTLRRKDGNPVVCLDNSTAIRDASGRIVRYQGTLVDITQRREMEKRLHSEQEFARRLVDSFPDLIAVLDTQGRYTYVSPRITETLGYQPEELLGQGLGERAYPEDRAVLLELFSDLICGKRPHAIVEFRAQNKQGDWRLLRASASPLFDSEGKMAGVIASSRDVTEIRRLEQQLTQSERLAAMGRMIAGVAHELNNPLTAILGISELLRERATHETSRHQLDLAHRQARRAAHIVQSLLAFSQPPAPGRAKVQLPELIQRTLQLHEQSLRGNNIALEFTAEEDLPGVAGDPNQLTQVFLNLITNAEDAIREVRERGTLRIHVSRAGNHVLATFQDDGVGIPREALPRLFDPFFTTKRPNRGTGLGLSICLAIAREHGGTIEARSLPEGGSIFSVSFRIASEQEAIPAPAVPHKARAEVISLQGLSILVVDDEESIRELVQDGLSARGLLVDCASTGEQALRLASENTYDAVLCDMNLTSPGQQTTMSGRELFERLAGGCSSQPGSQKPLFIFMTGDLVDGNTLEALNQGDSRVIQKPFRISDLVAVLTEALGSVAGGPLR